MKTNQRFVLLALVATLLLSSLANAQEKESIFKRKWNPKAKGTAIGAGAGGVAGAIIHKRNRKVGAGVGMAAGAAIGYGVGTVIDNKQKRAAAARAAAEERERVARTSKPAATRVTDGTAQLAANKPMAPAAALMPAEATQSLTRNGFLLNTDFGNSASAYPTSEYRRKSW
jgi:phage tail tape-measure protein